MKKYLSFLLVLFIFCASIPVLANGTLEENSPCEHRPDRFINRGHNDAANEHTYGLVCGACNKEYEVVTFWCPGGPVHCEPF